MAELKKPSEMTNDELAAATAVEVMGWVEYEQFFGNEHRDIMFTKDDTSYGPGWNPAIIPNSIG